MTRYLFEPGKHNAKPLEPIWPRFASGFTGEFVLHKSCWFSKDEWQNDNDYYDWNFKIIGITSALSLNNRASAIIAARPIDEENRFIVTGYTNDRKGGFQTGQHTEAIGVLIVEAEQKCVVRCNIKRRGWRKHRVEYAISNGLNSIYVKHDFDAPWHGLYRQIGTWFGGSDSDGNGIGGVPHKPMSLHASIRID